MCVVPIQTLWKRNCMRNTKCWITKMRSTMSQKKICKVGCGTVKYKYNVA